MINKVSNFDMPRERLFQVGPSALAEYELVSIILGVGGKDTSVIDIAKKLTKQYGGWKGVAQLTSTELLATKYIGKSKAASLMAAGELGLRLVASHDATTKLRISSPNDVYTHLRSLLFMKKRECMYMLSLDSRNRLIGTDLISVGTINETLLSPREIFRQALLRNAVAIVLAHNHPTNESAPSSADLVITEQVAVAGKHIGITLLDHVIICDHEFTSIKELKVFETTLEGGEQA